MSAPQQDHAHVVILPPLLYAGAFGVTLLLHWLWPLPLLPKGWALGLGLPLIGAAAGLLAWGKEALDRAGTAVNPYAPTTALVTDGPYRFSRNPLYVALTLFFVGLCLAVDTGWGGAVLVPVLLVMHWGVVLREERYLERKFGDRYREYRAAVRRYF